MSIVIDIDGVCKSYKNVKALDNFSLHIDKGELFGLIGPNGAGKTTFLKILAGLLNIDEGKITIDGNDMQERRKA